jgi:CheY-like chemotaxis protein
MTRILIADDDKSIREMLTMMLESFDYEVLSVEDGIEALDRLNSAQGRLVVILDICMPRLNGRELLQEVANDPVLSVRHRYILLSASNNLTPSKLGTIPFPITIIPKPFSMDELLDAVDKASQALTAPMPAIAHC